MRDHPILGRLFDLPAGWHERVAFRWSGGSSLDFAGLRTGALSAAAWLAGEAGAGPGERVALCLPKCAEAVLLIHGSAVAGAAYVPLQAQEPPARLRAILDSIRPRLLLTTQEKAAQLRADGGEAGLPPIRTIDIAGDGRGLEPLLAGIAPQAHPAAVGTEDPFALYFTSGSTGEPKGVVYSVRGMAAALAGVTRLSGMTEDDRLLSLGGLHYASTAGIFYPLLAGCGCYLLTEREGMVPLRTAEVLAEEKISIWLASATAWRILVESGQLAGRDLSALRMVKLVGEPISIPALRRSLELLHRARFFNHYAASEAFYIAEHEIARPLAEGLETLPLGRPSDLYELSLRDETGEAVAPGEIGEICVAGPAVLQGYWQDAALTAAKRLPGRADSFRTGDLARIGPDGLIHLAGRRDHVVKLRGQRFDLGEIEAALKSHPGVSEAVAVVRPRSGGDDAIQAAVLAPGTPAPSLTEELQAICVRRLPGFARPRRILVLADFPLLPSGKIDRRRLQALLQAPGGAIGGADG
jgi:L-proline---[L-prolyl-carrier protein] ligase